MKKKFHYRFSGIWMLHVLTAQILPAQQVPLFNTYLDAQGSFNPAAVGGTNPAYSGIVYRSQFWNLPVAERPTTPAVYADLSPFVSRISPRIGIGFTLMQDRLLFIRTTGLNAFFAYQLIPAQSLDEFSLTLGVSSGFNAYKFDFAKSTISDPFDVTLIQANDNKKKGFNAGPGIQMRYPISKDNIVQFDGAFHQLFSTNPSWKSKENPSKTYYYNTKPNFLGIIRFKSRQSDTYTIEPLLAFRKTFGEKKNASGLDAWLRFNFLENERLGVGAGWRTGNGGFLASANFVFNDWVKINCYYEYHGALGSTVEFGACYLMDGVLPKCSGKKFIPALKNNLGNVIKEYNLFNGYFQKANQVALKIEKTLNAASQTKSYTVQSDSLERARQYLLIEQPILIKLRNNLSDLYVEYSNLKGGILKEITSSGRPFCEQVMLDSVGLLIGNMQSKELDISTRLANFDESIQSMPRLLNLESSVEIQDYFLKRIKRYTGQIPDISLKQVYGNTIEFEFNLLKDTSQFGPKSQFFKSSLDPLRRQGLNIQSIKIFLDIPGTEKLDAKYGNAVYQGNSFSLFYRFNGKDKTEVMRPGSKFTVEQNYLVLFELFRQLLLEDFGLRSDALIKLELNTINSAEKKGKTRIVFNY